MFSFLSSQETLDQHFNVHVLHSERADSLAEDGMIYKKELDTELPSLVASASGVVVELGPGSGNQLGRYDKKKVKKVLSTLLLVARTLHVLQSSRPF